jgi:hypothetical protein
MTSRADELETFKTQINLVAFAEDQGFVVDRKKSSRTSIAMQHEGSGERILVRRNPNGHYVYASVHDPSDNGTVVDFLQRRGGGSLGAVRKALRPWIGVAPGPLSLRKSRSERTNTHLEAQSEDLEGVQEAFAVMSPITAPNGYLEERGIPASIYMHPRFEGRIRVDGRRNVAFPHWRPGELTGFELKNRGFTGFAKGGRKALWSSRRKANDQRLVVCETAIDALSYAALFGVEDAQLVSTAGALNPAQPALLQSAVEGLPAGGQVIFAVDADRGGDALCEQLEGVLEAAKGLTLTWDRHSPQVQGQDWNDVLRGHWGPPGPSL